MQEITGTLETGKETKYLVKSLLSGVIFMETSTVGFRMELLYIPLE